MLALCERHDLSPDLSDAPPPESPAAGAAGTGGDDVTVSVNLVPVSVLALAESLNRPGATMNDTFNAAILTYTGWMVHVSEGARMVLRRPDGTMHEIELA